MFQNGRRPGLRPGLHWGSLRRSPRPPSRKSLGASRHSRASPLKCPGLMSQKYGHLNVAATTAKLTMTSSLNIAYSLQSTILHTSTGLTSTVLLVVNFCRFRYGHNVSDLSPMKYISLGLHHHYSSGSRRPSVYFGQISILLIYVFSVLVPP